LLGVHSRCGPHTFAALVERLDALAAERAKPWGGGSQDSSICAK
jgi:hypothetical protein